MHLPIVTLKKARHKEAEVIQVHFEKNDILLQTLRTFKPLRWSKTMQCWYLPFSHNLRQDLFQLLKGKAWLNYQALNSGYTAKSERSKNESTFILTKKTIESKTTKELLKLSEEGQNKLETFRSWMRSKRYSESTIGTYTEALSVFLRFYTNKKVEDITNDDLILFNNDYIIFHKLSASYQNQVVNAIKLFFRTIQKRSMDVDMVHRPKRAKDLPNVLSKEEVKLILSALNNIKHKAMLSLIYACGLRCGELLRLRPEHLDEKRKVLLVKQSKGKKDRIVPLSDKVAALVSEHLRIQGSSFYLFEGQRKEQMYDERSLQQVLKNSLIKAGIKKPVTLHWLRHSYATHLLESGTNLRYIQEILGHNSSKTTEIYTHVSNLNIQRIVSPFDTL